MLAPIEEMLAYLDSDIRLLLRDRDAIDTKLLVLREAWRRCDGIKSKIKKAAS